MYLRTSLLLLASLLSVLNVTAKPMLVERQAASTVTVTVTATADCQVSRSAQSSTPVSSAPRPTGSSFQGSLQWIALKHHNEFRAQHGAAALSWNWTLADAAQRWGDRCEFIHSGGTLGPFGENLAAMSGQNHIGAGIGLWNSQAPDYNPENPNYSHFTQVVWKSTTQLGCSVTVCPEGSIFPAEYGPARYFVCEYFPQGNVYPASNFHANVQP